MVDFRDLPAKTQEAIMEVREGLTEIEAQPVPYSSVVGSSVMVNAVDGPCVAMVSIRGASQPLSRRTSEALAELISAAINQLHSMEGQNDEKS